MCLEFLVSGDSREHAKKLCTRQPYKRLSRFSADFLSRDFGRLAEK
jgi:TonB family protein